MLEKSLERNRNGFALIIYNIESCISMVVWDVIKERIIMDVNEIVLLIVKCFALFFIITYAVKLGVKEALTELKNNEKNEGSK